MGLDMYLRSKRYLSEFFTPGDDEKANTIQKLFPELDALGLCRGGRSPVEEVTVEVGYWRKANHIHKWFVDNCQDGTDDCGRYCVDREQLEELHDLCCRVRDFKHLANELLPTQSGFFFGDTEYGEGYYADIDATIAICEAALSLPNQWNFEYHSSW